MLVSLKRLYSKVRSLSRNYKKKKGFPRYYLVYQKLLWVSLMMILSGPLIPTPEGGDQEQLQYVPTKESKIGLPRHFDLLSNSLSKEPQFK